MSPRMVILPCVLLFAADALASCAYGTSLHPRQEGTVEVNTFGYSALTVRIDKKKSSSSTRRHVDNLLRSTVPRAR